MAILDPDVHGSCRALSSAAPVPTPVPQPDDQSGAAARVRRHALRRLLVADVVGLAFAAFVGPLVVSAVSNNPASAASRSARIYLFDLAMIPLFIGGLRPLRPVPGDRPGASRPACSPTSATSCTP